MTPHSRIRRIGWLAALATCTALYLMLHGNTALEPVVAGGSLIVAAAILIFAVVVFSSEPVPAASGLQSAPR